MNFRSTKGFRRNVKHEIGDEKESLARERILIILREHDGGGGQFDFSINFQPVVGTT